MGRSDQRVKVCFIYIRTYHEVLFKCEECFINWSTVLNLTINYSYIWNAYHYLVDAEGVNTPSHSFSKIVNNVMQLAVSVILFNE